MSIPSKPRKCRVCKTEFQPVRCLQTVCSPECAIKQAQFKRAKAERIQETAERKTIKIKLEKLKTTRDWIKDAQTAFNKYIRARDESKTCISCGTSWGSREVGGSFDCGHYRSVGSAPHLRFDDRNAHGQCKKCNRYGSGMAVDYRRGLIQRIGIEAVESVESDQAPKKYTIEQLKEIISTYKRKLKGLKNGR